MKDMRRMRNRLARRLPALAAVLAAGALLASSGLASAHEHRDVGNYTLVVGFLTEPAIANEPNGLSLRVETKAAADAATPSASPAAGDDDALTGAPVDGLADTLQAEVTFGSQTQQLDLEPAFGQPGAYEAHFIPTAEGAYSFHIFGTIDGANVDETFTSGPDTFDEVAARSTMNFPPDTASGSDSAAVKQAKDDASTARTLAIVGIVLGALGLVAAGGVTALGRGKRGN
jgi:hypothetical protein